MRPVSPAIALAAVVVAVPAIAADDRPTQSPPRTEAVTAEEFLEIVTDRTVRGQTIPDRRHFTYNLHANGTYDYTIDASADYASVIDAGNWWEAPGGFCFRSTAGRFEGCRRIMKSPGQIYHVVDQGGRLIATWTVDPRPASK